MQQSRRLELSRRAMLAGTALAASSAAWAQAPAATPPQEAPPGAPGGGARGRGPAFPPSIERFDPALDALLDVNAPIEHIATGAFQWCEGPVWIGGADGYLLASDPRANAILQWSPGGGLQTWLKPSGYQGAPDPQSFQEPGTNGLLVGRGGLVAADQGNRAVVAIDIASKRRTVLCDHFEGKRFNSPNDLVLSPATGMIYFTEPPFGMRGIIQSPLREMDYTGVFRLAPDNSVTLIGKYNMPNGIGLSPDGRTLYTSDRVLGWLAHTLDAQGNALSQRVFIDLKAENVMPRGDGMKIDAAGNMWTSGDSGIGIFNPQGHRIGRIRISGSAPNCAFGADGHLYIANGNGLLRMPCKAKKIPSQ
jgi:gluconolactonase